MTSREPTTTDPIGQASPFDRQNVTVSAGSARSVDANALGDHGIPEPGAIDVERHAVRPGDRSDLAGVLGRERLAHRLGVRVLDGDQAGDRFVEIGRVAEGGFDVGWVERPVRPVLERSDARPDDDRVAGRLVDDDVVLAPGDRLLAAPEVRHLGHEVAHRSGGHEQPGFLAK